MVQPILQIGLRLPLTKPGQGHRAPSKANNTAGIGGRSGFLLIGITYPLTHNPKWNLKCGLMNPFAFGFMVFDQPIGKTFNKSRSI